MRYINVAESAGLYRIIIINVSQVVMQAYNLLGCALSRGANYTHNSKCFVFFSATLRHCYVTKDIQFTYFMVRFRVTV